MIKSLLSTFFFKRSVTRAPLFIAFLFILSACQEDLSISSFQGYGEGEFIYLSAYEAGNIETLNVLRGNHVAAGKVLFVLDSTVQANLLREAEGQLEVARHQLANLLVGKREQEIAVLIAGQKRAAAALKLSKEQLARKITLRKDAFISQAALD